MKTTNNEVEFEYFEVNGEIYEVPVGTKEIKVYKIPMCDAHQMDCVCGKVRPEYLEEVVQLNDSNRIKTEFTQN